jgi:hypothetical protein
MAVFPRQASQDACVSPRRVALRVDSSRAVPRSGRALSPNRQRASDKGLLLITLNKYLELLDWTGRQARSDKPGAIPRSLAPILDRLGINRSNWLPAVLMFDEWFGHVVGSVSSDRGRTARGPPMVQAARPAARLSSANRSTPQERRPVNCQLPRTLLDFGLD